MSYKESEQGNLSHIWSLIFLDPQDNFIFNNYYSRLTACGAPLLKMKQLLFFLS